MFYLYCVTKKAGPGFLDAREEVAEDLQVISSKGISAVVGRVSGKEFGEDAFKENLANMRWLESRAVTHETVVEKVMRDGPVVPFKFATVFKTEGRVRALLAEQAENYGGLLEWFSDKQEWGIKAYCNTGGLRKILEKTVIEIKLMEEKIKSSSAGKGYLLRKKADAAALEALRKCTASIIDDSMKRLKAQSISVQLNKNIPGAAGADKEMILNSACLVETAGLDRFGKAMEALSADYGGHAVEFVRTGPWPPYHFSSCMGEQ